MSKNENLENEMKKMKQTETNLKNEIGRLKERMNSASTDAVVSISKDEKDGSKSTLDESLRAADCQNETRPAASVTVSVRRTSTVIEKKRMVFGGKVSRIPPAHTPDNRASPSFSKNQKNHTSVDPRNESKTSHPDKINIQHSDLSLKLSSSGIVSSPTSGASNFALNSPNQLTPSSSFPAPALPGKSQKLNCVPSGSFQATRQKFQRFSSSKPSPPTIKKSDATSFS